MINFGALSKISLLTMIVVFIIGFSSFFTKNSNQMVSSLRLNTATALFGAFLMCIGVLYLNKISTFLYFNF
jgi:CRISPR/Cas system-associated protein Cas5 (RAMP superfamily)